MNNSLKTQLKTPKTKGFKKQINRTRIEGTRNAQKIEEKTQNLTDFPSFANFNSFAIPSDNNFPQNNFSTIPIQTKLKIGSPNDKYEREADVMADRIMRMPMNSAISKPFSSTGPAIQAKCAACNHEEEKIQCKPLMMKSEGGTPIATQALGSQLTSTSGSGSPLPPATKSFMTNAFGTDFSNVRVHTDSKAQLMNKGLNARAFTHGSDVYFNKGQYSPGSSEGKRLLGHELTHVVQQAKAISKIQRWAISGDDATSNSSSDILGNLAKGVGAKSNDWPCIIPVSMRTSRMTPPPANFNENYERYVNIGDKFNVSNLRKKKGPNLRIHLFTNPRDIGIAARFYPGMNASSGNVDIDISSAASDGITPINNLVIFGHATGTSMFGGTGTFDPTTLTPIVHSFNLAKAKLLPRRCWFTRKASVRSVGCNSMNFAQVFAGLYLRHGSQINSTTRSVSPCCHGVWNQLAFTAGSAAGSRILDGPHRTTRAFHNSRFWERIRGK